MKFAFLCYFLCQSLLLTHAQTATYNADNESRGINPGLQFAFQQLNSKALRSEVKIDIDGSPFVSDKFVKTGIYGPDGLEGYAYSRYDGYNDELQLKRYLKDSTISVLLKREDIFCVVNDTTIFFKDFHDKKGKLHSGHLFRIYEDNHFIIFDRRLKKYKDGKPATNSFQIAVKDRFVSASELYYSRKKEEDIRYLKRTKKDILKVFTKDVQKLKAIKAYMSDFNLDMKDSGDIISVFQYYRNL